MGGCNSGGGLVRVDDQKEPFNRWTVQTLDDESISNAIITQHTLYPYHFVTGSAELNRLGERDVKVLAAHMVRNPGDISVHKGGEGQALYDARVKAVTEALIKYEVPAGSIKIVDRMPGGDGVPSERAVLILKRSYESSSIASDGSQTMSNTGQGQGSATGTGGGQGGK
jgi:hypothetical protein